MSASVTQCGLLDMQVCVPSEWTDDQVLVFAASKNPCGTENGWAIRRQGADGLGGDDERVKCEALPEHVHIMLDA